MSRPTFGDPAAIARYTPNHDHVYTIWELFELDWCPQALKDAYDAAMDEGMDEVVTPAMKRAEKNLIAWGRAQGYRVVDAGEGVQP